MSREVAIGKAIAHLDEGVFKNELAELVSYPTESQNPDSAAVLVSYLENAIRPKLENLGFTIEVIKNPDLRGGPLLIGERIEGGDLPTILTYGHGDVVSGQKEMWDEGLTPFTLIEQGDRYYGRGTADNKCQHLINIAALEAVHSVRGRLGFNIRIILEMSEELGSIGLADVLHNYMDRLTADLLIGSDGPRVQPNVPTVFLGSRGGITFDLELNLRDGAHHSGNWGGLLADPAMILAHALATITDQRGQIKIKEWRPNSLTDEVRAALDGLVLVGDDGPAVDVDWGEQSLTPAERVYGWNSLAILGISNGAAEPPLNAIAASARATCRLQFVVGTDPQDIIPALRRHLDAHGYDTVKILPRNRDYFRPTRLDLKHPWVRFCVASIEQTAGVQPQVLPNFAGSVPNESFVDILDLPTVWIPHSYRGCSQHAPNEHVLKSVCRDALSVMAGLFWDLGSKNG